jgi:hypothetical protein
MTPSDDLVSEGYCLAKAGKEYIVYQHRAKAFSLKLAGLATPLKSQWYQPLTGKHLDAGMLYNGTVQLTPPGDWSDGPVALHVGSLFQAVERRPR